MDARTILSVLSLVFLTAATLRYYRDGGHIVPASKAWYLVASIFALVSGWLWLQ
ncbi:hypothetical protein [Pseudoduganella violaceinigra]|uniref:hypothetical protein n=1 Tax=Pseudoduganella violaceinigra TaxID=246602 RepID=UPI000403E4E1|nr:hypothetical protein [Pseudoduganella violaceinigra]